MVSIFGNQSLSWYSEDVRIGYMGDQTHSLFGPLDNTTFFSLFIAGTAPYSNEVFTTGTATYYNEVYQLSIDGARLSQVQPGKPERERGCGY